MKKSIIAMMLVINTYLLFGYEQNSVSASLTNHLVMDVKEAASCAERTVTVYTQDAFSSVSSPDAQFNPYCILNPYGVWEIVDSIRAYPQYTPQDIEPWPIEPIANGKHIVITGSAFSVDDYNGFSTDGSDVLFFKYVKYKAINFDYFWHFRMTHEAEIWVCSNLPSHTFSVNFFQEGVDISYYYPDREVFFVDYDTILYTDPYYFYKLRRVEIYDIPYNLPFTDVIKNAWYHEDVELAHKNELIHGRTATLFGPDDYITYAETVKISACLYQLWRTGIINLKNGDATWYDTYMDYAMSLGIIEFDLSDCANEKITRRDFVNIFYKALPDSEYPSINDLEDDAISDVTLKSNDVSSKRIYTFYRAGIITKLDDNGAFNPNEYIPRYEVVDILTKMLDKSYRTSIEYGA